MYARAQKDAQKSKYPLIRQQIKTLTEASFFMNSRDKGKRGELALVRKIKEYGYDVRRSQQYAGINNDADVVGIDRLHIECKYTKNGHGATYEWIEQAIRDKADGECPVVMHKKVSKDDRGNEWLVTMTLDDFMKLWSEGGENADY